MIASYRPAMAPSKNSSGCITSCLYDAVNKTVRNGSTVHNRRNIAMVSPALVDEETRSLAIRPLCSVRGDLLNDPTKRS
jgi:hypothetical protein